MLRCVLTQTFLEDPSLRGGLVDASRNSRRCQRRPTCKGTAGITPYFQSQESSLQRTGIA